MRQVPLAVALGTLLLAPGTARAQARSITLADAIRLSERVQPGVVRATGAVTTAAAERRSAMGSYLPSVTASSSASDFYSEGPSRVDPVTGQVLSGSNTNRSVSTSLSASMDLFTGFRRGAENRAAKAGQTAAEASLVDARFQQALATTNQFFNALAAAQLVKVRQASVRRAEEQLKVSVNKLLAGSATRSDTLRSRVTLGSANLDLIQAGTALATAEAELARLVGEPGRLQAADDSTFYQVVAPLDTVAIRTEAEATSPLVRSTMAEADAARAGLSAAKSAYWPSLTLGGSTSWNATGANDYELLNQRQLTLGLRWNLFDRFDRELSITQQSADLDVADASAADARREVASQLTAALAQLDAARTQIDITETSVVAATEDLRVQQERYRLGASTIVDVLSSQEALNQAEVDVVVARFTYLRAKAQIEALIGRTL
ncbi:MAG TPA: TolC family protein [Gemmatimonadales bacterium]|nr:TolC family protein [Gemmatimonadales bacterium]